jgi:hypothetical protein
MYIFFKFIGEKVLGMLSGKVAIIIGAGRGQGREKALAMAKEGWKDNGRYIIQVRTENAVVINDAYAIVD